MPQKPLSELEDRIGETVETVDGLRIERGKVAEFAHSLRDENSIFHNRKEALKHGYEDIPAPLTFTRTAYFPRYRPPGIDENLGFDLGLREEDVLHGEQSYEFERPIVSGDVLTGETTLVDIYQREGDRGGTMTFVVYETKYRDEDGELVLTERLTRIETDGEEVTDDGNQ